MRVLTGKIVNKSSKNDITVLLYSEEEVKDYIFANLFDLEDTELCLDYYLQNYLSNEINFIQFTIEIAG